MKRLFRNLFGTIIQPISTRKQPRRVRPSIEPLEARLTPITTRTWIGDPDNFQWNVAGNWTDDAGNFGVPQAGERLRFPANALSFASNNNFTDERAFNSIVVESSGYSISSPTAVSLLGSEPVRATFAASNSSLNMQLNFIHGSAQVKVDNANATLRLNFAVHGTQINKTGLGTVELSGTNDYTGQTLVSAGTLSVIGDNRLSDDSDVSVAVGAAIHFTGSDHVDSLEGGGTVIVDAGKRLWAGRDNGDTSFSGAITGNLSKEGTGTMTLSGGTYSFGDGTNSSGLGIDNGRILLGAANIINDNTFINTFSTGTLDLNSFSETIGSLGGAGTIKLGDSGFPVLTVGANGQDTTFSGAITGLTGTNPHGELRKVGGGSLHLTGTVTAFMVEVEGGTLALDTNNIIDDRTFVDVASPGQMKVNAFDNIGCLSGSGLVDIAAGIRLWVGGNGSQSDFSGSIRGNGTSGGLSKQGGGVMTLSGGPYFFPDGLGIENGTIRLGAANILDDSTFVNQYAGGILDLNNFDETIGSLSGNGTILLGAVTLTVGGNGMSTSYDGLINGAGGLIKVGAESLTLTNSNSNHTGFTWVRDGTLALGGTGLDNHLILGPLFVGDSNGAADSAVLRLDRNHPIGDGIGVTINSDGLFDGNGHDEYLGALAVIGGEVRMGNADLGLNGVLTMLGGSVSASGALGLRPFAGIVTQPSAQTATISGKVDLAGATRTFTVNDGAGTPFYDLVIDGVISNGGVTKDGAGNMYFVGALANTYVGTTTVNSGGLTLGKTSGVTAVAGPLVIGSAGVQLDSDNQIADTAPITINGGFLQPYLGSDTIGPLTMTGGGISIFEGRTLTLSAGLATNASANSSVITTGGTGNPGQLSLGGVNQIFNIADGAVTSDLVIAEIITNGSLTKAGPGTLVLGGNNTYGGSTTVNAGTLLVNGSIASSPTTVNGGILGGAGFVGLVTMNGGMLSPGLSPGRLNSGNVTMNAASTFRAELNGTTAGTSYDQLNVTGAVNLGGSTLNASLGFTVALGDSFIIVNNDGTDAVTGTFSGLAEGAFLTVNGQSMRITYTGGTGNDIVLTRQNPGQPGITVTPTSGLVTTEAGGTATFTVVLNSTPTANVTIALNSSDATEGTVSPTMLTFTPANALVPQTVTVTGGDDQLVDGNIAYQIITNPAISSDPAYQGLNPADVSVTNNDNDVNSGPTVSFQVPSSNGSEALNPAKLVLVLSQPLPTKVKVYFAITGGTATAGTDFTYDNLPVKFKPGKTQKKIKLYVINDAIREPDETVDVRLTSVTGANLGAQTTHTYTILNDDTTSRSRRSASTGLMDALGLLVDLTEPDSSARQSADQKPRSSDQDSINAVLTAWKANQERRFHDSISETIRCERVHEDGLRLLGLVISRRQSAAA